MKNIKICRGSSATTLGWLLVCGGLTAALGAQAAETPDAEAKSLEEKLEAYSNWIEFSAGGLTLDGNRGAFQQRYQVRRGAFGGMEDFHYQRDLGKKVTLLMDGRVMFDQQDYKARLEIQKEDLGFLRGGMSYYRTWDDGSGGFFRPTEGWYDLYDDALGLDRGEFWVEGGLRLKKLPQLTLKYTHQMREGLKSSTSWGYVHPYGLGPVRGIVPSFYDLDEERDILQADLRHTLGKFTLGAGVRYDRSDLDNARKMRQWPGEAADRHVTHRETVRSEAWSAHAFVESRLHKKLFFSTGYGYTTLDSDVGGSRVYGNDYDVQFVPALASGLGFYGLSGGSQLKDHVANLNLMYNPWPNLTLVPSFRVQRTASDSEVWYFQTGVGPVTPVSARSDREVLDLAEELELRYTGVTNWVFYARGEWMQGEGDLTEIGAAFPLPVNHYVEDSRLGQKYTVGVNWYASRRVTLDVQYYRKMRSTDYDHLVDSTANDPLSPNRYPGFIAGQDFTTDDVNARLTLRPHQKLTLVSRYDYQISTVDTKPVNEAGLPEVESGKITSHVFAQNLTYVPWSRLYLQGGFNVVFSKTETPVSSFTQAVLDARNNYWSASATVGWVVDNKTDLQTTYFYYRAFDNYSDNSTFGVPYGANAREHAVTVGLTRRLRDNIRLALKYGFFTHRDATAGGRNDFDAHMVYSSLQIRF